MGVPTSEVGYTSATTGRGDHEVHKGHVVALAKKFDSKCEPSLSRLQSLIQENLYTAECDLSYHIKNTL
jgi:hypothetical protein